MRATGWQLAWSWAGLLVWLSFIPAGITLFWWIVLVGPMRELTFWAWVATIAAVSIIGFINFCLEMVVRSASQGGGASNG